MNIDELLTPISDSAPCGEDLSFSSEFDAIAEMRREDDPTLDQGEWVTPLKTADWGTAQARCGDLLAKRSKDLRLAMWWAEAATQTAGYEGLQQGLRLCTSLCERYWDGLYPEAEGGDMEQRVGNMGWFLTRVVSLCKARRVSRDVSKDVLRQNVAAVQACQEALSAWQAVIDAKLGAEGPSFVPAREAIAAALHDAQRVAREAGALASAPSAATASASALGDASAARSAGPLRTREQALAQLREVAAFFRATEPHSPVAYLAEKAVHWGDMPLHLWLRSVVKDEAALAHLEELLGLEAPRDPS